MGSFLRSLRERRGLSLDQVAEAMGRPHGVFSQSIGAWERGVRKPYAHQLAGLLSALDASDEERVEALRLAEEAASASAGAA